jgi:H+/Cl- antiporter ClcA
MSTALGLLAFVAYVAVIVGLAAGVTWLVVKFSPKKKPDTQSS